MQKFWIFLFGAGVGFFVLVTGVVLRPNSVKAQEACRGVDRTGLRVSICGGLGTCRPLYGSSMNEIRPDLSPLDIRIENIPSASKYTLQVSYLNDVGEIINYDVAQTANHAGNSVTYTLNSNNQPQVFYKSRYSGEAGSGETKLLYVHIDGATCGIATLQASQGYSTQLPPPSSTPCEDEECLEDPPIAPPVSACTKYGDCVGGKTCIYVGSSLQPSGACCGSGCGGGGGGGGGGDDDGDGGGGDGEGTPDAGFDIFKGPNAETFKELNPFTMLESPVAGQFNSPAGIVNRVMMFLWPLAGLALFFMLVWGGFEILSKASDAKAVQAGRQRITMAVIGFVLLFASYWIMQIVQWIFGLSIL